MLNRERLGATVGAWRARPVTSKRLFGTGIGIAVIGVPFSLWFVIVGPTAGDRLVALGFLAVCVVLGVYSLWEAKAEVPPRSDGRDDRP